MIGGRHMYLARRATSNSSEPVAQTAFTGALSILSGRQDAESHFLPLLLRAGQRNRVKRWVDSTAPTSCTK